MPATSSPVVPATGGLRSVIARHPVAAMLIMMFVIGWAVLMPPAIAGLDLVPFFLLATVLFAQLLPAVLVTAAVGGRPAVRELFSRVFRWRVSLVWYLVALLAIPVAALLISVAFFGNGAVHALLTDRSIQLGYLASLTILPLVNLWEETAFTGVIQARLALGRGPLAAAAITGVFFALIHGNSIAEAIPWVTIGVLGLVVAVLTRGRLGARDEDVERYAGAPAPAPSAA